MTIPALRASWRRLAPAGTSISFFSLTKTTLGIEPRPYTMTLRASRLPRGGGVTPPLYGTFPGRSTRPSAGSLPTPRGPRAAMIYLAHLSDIHIRSEERRVGKE